MEFSEQQYWSELPLPSPGDLPCPGMKPGCPTLQAESFRLGRQAGPMGKRCAGAARAGDWTIRTFLCGGTTVPHLEPVGGFTNLHMWQNVPELYTKT